MKEIITEALLNAVVKKQYKTVRTQSLVNGYWELDILEWQDMCLDRLTLTHLYPHVVQSRMLPREEAYCFCVRRVSRIRLRCGMLFGYFVL